MKLLQHSPLRYLLATLALPALLLAACTRPIDPPDPVEENGTFELNFAVRAGGQSYAPAAMLTNILEQQYHLDVYKMYIGNIRLVKKDGSELALADVELLDFMSEYGKTDHGGGLYRQYDVPVGEYAGVRFGIGVPGSLNHENPAQYANTHPLSAAKGMHWNWNNGYIFTSLVGQVDSSDLPGFQGKEFVYHTGLDEMYRNFDFTLPEHAFAVSANQELRFPLEIDLNRLFYNATDTVNMVTENITHVVPPGSPAYDLSLQITNNMASGALIKLPF